MNLEYFETQFSRCKNIKDEASVKAVQQQLEFLKSKTAYIGEKYLRNTKDRSILRFEEDGRESNSVKYVNIA